MTASPDYLPIAGYAAIGNLRSVALVGLNGSIDWCCLPELSRPSVFGAILDHRRGGRFRLSPAEAVSSHARYRGDTLVLDTRFEAEGGKLMLTDFMPLRSSILEVSDPDTGPDIYRVLWCSGGEVRVEVEWSPRFDYGRARTVIEPAKDGFRAAAGGEAMLLTGLNPGEARIVDRGNGPAVVGALQMQAGDRRVLAARYAAARVEHAPERVDEERLDASALRLLQQTCDAWVEWSHHHQDRPTEEWAGEWAPMVKRSELVLKMLSHPDTGAIAAAPTTSLPESIGGVRNWDYRHCWVRDGALVIQALHALGHSREAYRFLHFLQRSVGERDDNGLQIMYGLHGETRLPERTLDHLEGYRGSAPVRIGNAAAGQRQHDTYGELLDAAHELHRRGERLGPETISFLSGIVQAACEAWREPDSGVWEVRGPERHFVHSKVMVWVALDRGVRLAESYGMNGDVERWRTTRDALKDLILRKGFDDRLGSFTQSFRTEAVDAASLRFAIEEFLPATHPRMQATIDRVLERLTENGLVYRYLSDDGLPPGEGAFCVCTFWLVDALTLAGRVDEALEVYSQILGRATGTGLLPEQIDPSTGEFLGNFPQAYSHIGVINSALYLAAAMERPVPKRAALVGMNP